MSGILKPNGFREIETSGRIICRSLRIEKSVKNLTGYGMSKKKIEKPNAVSKCRDCKLTTTDISRYEYFKPSRPRCNACGGTMEYLPFIEGTTRDAPSRKQA